MRIGLPVEAQSNRRTSSVRFTTTEEPTTRATAELTAELTAVTSPTRAPALDGMRAVLVLLVIAYHLWSAGHHWPGDPGSLGVTGFFALSGYLITGLLIREHAATGRVHMAYFYARRALRLLPALCFLLGVWLLVVILFPHAQFVSTVPSATSPGNPVSWITGFESVGAALLYVTNLLNIEPHWHLWYGYSPLGHLWTLAVEEQFYVIWAPVMILLLRLRRHTAILVAAAIALFALLDPIFWSSSSMNRVYFGTDTRSAALFCGALCAFIGSTGAWRVLRRATWAPAFGAAILVLCGWACFALGHEGDRATWNAGLIVGSIACALGVVFVAERPHAAAGRFLSSPTLVAIGKRSYALYLWSYVLNTWLRDTGFFETFLVISMSFLAAEISYRLVELPALAHKHRFTPRGLRRNDTPGADEPTLVLSGTG
jgi:peptidoglycan/LPS O-acetylase OafA/YrhL